MQGGMGDQGPAGAVVSFICHYFLMRILEVFFSLGGDLWCIFVLTYIFSDPFDCMTRCYFC